MLWGTGSNTKSGSVHCFSFGKKKMGRENHLQSESNYKPVLTEQLFQGWKI